MVVLTLEAGVVLTATGAGCPESRSGGGGGGGGAGGGFLGRGGTGGGWGGSSGLILGGHFLVAGLSDGVRA